MGQNTTSISVRGDRNYVKRIKMLAYSRGLTMAELVRFALDTADVDAIETPSFFEDNGHDSVQSDANAAKKKPPKTA